MFNLILRYTTADNMAFNYNESAVKVELHEQQNCCNLILQQALEYIYICAPSYLLSKP